MEKLLIKINNIPFVSFISLIFTIISIIGITKYFPTFFEQFNNKYIMYVCIYGSMYTLFQSAISRYSFNLMKESKDDLD